MEKLKVGQKLWWVPRYNRTQPQHEVTVTKVGRKWAQLDNHYRISLETFKADGGGYAPPGTCYPSKAHFDAITELNVAWNHFIGDLRNMRLPDGVTVEDVEAARKLLRMGV